MDRKKILLLHGALGNKHQFVRLKGYLQSTFDVYDLDFEGHSGLPTDKEFSMEVFSKNVYDCLQANNITSIHIFGYSMGGYVALRYAFEYPEFVNKIITLGTKFDWSEEVAQRETRMLNPEKIEEKVPKFAEKLKEVHGENNWKEVLNKTANMMSELGNGKKMALDQLKKIQHEVQINIGNRDTMVTIEESETVARTLPNGTVQILDGFEHPIEKNDQKKLADIITEFIE